MISKEGVLKMDNNLIDNEVLVNEIASIITNARNNGKRQITSIKSTG